MKSNRYHFVHLLLTSVNTWTTVMEYVLPYNVCLSTHLHSNDLVGHHLHPKAVRLRLVVLQAVVLSRMCGEVKIHLSGSCIVVKYMKDGIKVNMDKQHPYIHACPNNNYFTLNVNFFYIVLNTLSWTSTNTVCNFVIFLLVMTDKEIIEHKLCNTNECYVNISTILIWRPSNALSPNPWKK